MMAGSAPACWTAENARKVFVTEALEGSDAIFLATHSPIRGFDVAGHDAGEFKECDERSVLDALADPKRRHAFCIVEGEPGSGKSHLIRWLSVNWPSGQDVKLLLRRADGSLEGALRQLRERLPTEFSSLFDNLGQKHRASIQGRGNIFLSTLANTLEPEHFDPPLGDEDWCALNAPAELLSHAWVKQRWNGPGRILALLEGGQGGRNSATASFDLFDIENLAACCGHVIGSGITARAETLAQRVMREGELIAAYREKGWTAEETAIEAPAELKASLKLIEVLNRRRNDAIQNVLGVSAQGLKTLFRSVRRALEQRGQRLVLLLEDITSWEGLDDSLIDVLVFNADAKGDDAEGDVCPLISVVGVTPAYYDKLQGNYRQRITHEIRLGRSQGGLQDVAMLRDPEPRRRFISQYLAAVRAGVPALESWRETLRHSSDAPPPIVCDFCPRQPSCFVTFGEHEGIGLFPFTAHSIERFFDALKDNDHGQTWRTPRGILQAILNPSLTQPEALSEGTYPGPLIEPLPLREDRRSDRVLSNRLAAIVSNRISTADEQAQMRRMLAYWAEPERADTTEVDGILRFAGAARDLFEAFGLPWIGGESASAAVLIPVVPNSSASGALFELTEPAEAEKSSQVTSAPRISRTQTRAQLNVPKPKRAGPTRTELEKLREQLRSWTSGGAIENGSLWNRFLHELLRSVDSRKLGRSPHLYERIITPEMVKLQGTTSGSRDYLVVDPEPWVRDGFEAYIALRLDSGISAEDAAFHYRNLAVMMRRLEAIARDYLDRRIPRLPSGERWSPAATMAQILLARAWLRGSVSPEAPLPEQLKMVLSDESEVASDPKSRCQPWQEWLTATDKWHDRIRSELRAMLSLSISDGGGGAGLTDVSDVAPALLRLRQTARVDDVPPTDGGLPDEFRKASELAQTWRDKCNQIDRVETTQLRNRSATLLGLLRNRAIADHLKRVDACVTRASELLPKAVPDQVSVWKQTYARMLPLLELGAGERVEALIVALEDPDDGVPARTAPRLGWLARAPVKDLESLLELAQTAEQVIKSLHEHASDCVREASGTGSLAVVKAVGRALRAAVGASDPAREAA